MNAATQAKIIVAHLLLAVLVLIAVTVLTAIGSPISAFVASIFTAIVVLAGSSATAASALGSALNGKAAVPSELIANQQQTIREGQHLLAAGAPLSEAAMFAAGKSTSPPLEGGGQV